MPSAAPRPEALKHPDRLGPQNHQAVRLRPGQDRHLRLTRLIIHPNEDGTQLAGH